LATAGSNGFQLEQLPYLGVAPIPTEIEPGGQWKSEPAVAEYLEWMRPVIDEIHAAAQYPTPVWQPIEFRGFATLLEELQNSRTLARLLSLDVEHALYHGDSDRALRSLQAMQGVAAAFDWQICIIADLVNLALHQTHQGMIQRSLAVNPWSEEQLQLLQHQMSHPREVPRRWQNVIAGERALAYGALDNGIDEYVDGTVLQRLEWIWRIPSVQENLLTRFRDIEILGDQGIVGLVERAKQLTQAWLRPRGQQVFFSFTHMFIGSFEAYARAIEREEMLRRLTLTAIAIKRFQLSTGQWPERLDQLEQVGLKPVDWHTTSAGQFGYEVDDEVAYVWSLDSLNETTVPADRPTLSVSDSLQPQTPLVVIR